MPLLVVGSVALDSVETPESHAHEVLGGSAVFFSYAASYFTTVRLVGVVGEDFPAEHRRLLEKRGIDTSGLSVQPGGKTFRWRGRYLPNMNDRETLEVHLNVFEEFEPVLNDQFRQCPFVFLANGSPVIQMKVLEQVPNAMLTMADTMDLWIETQRDELETLLKRVDGLVMNDQEAKLLANDENLVRAGHKIQRMGPHFVVIKKGEHGAMFFSADETYVLPAFPTANVVDPTGAGDSFAGGMMGYLAASRDEGHDPSPHNGALLKQAIAYGIITASFTVEDFSLNRLRCIERGALEQRWQSYREMVSL